MFFAVIVDDPDRALVARALRRHQREETDPIESTEASRIAERFERPTPLAEAVRS